MVNGLVAAAALVGVFVILAVVFLVVAPMIKNAGKKKRGPGSR